ncbi:glycerol-3-phosphate dehydrogenase [Nematocida ausubeli]|nr:glycerol-3-phosphate dehydrogenase [Nematocida ausubeli]
MSILRSTFGTMLAGAVIVDRILTVHERNKHKERYSKSIPLSWMPPSRSALLKKIKPSYDIVIIGGGSVGAGCFLDAVTRGYSVLLLEKNDFSSGTSSKSTKLIHGGIRYLETALKQLSYKHLFLVVEGLKERKTFLSLAPYLTRSVPIILPISSKLTIPYYWFGAKMYDWLSIGHAIAPSSFLPFSKIKTLLPGVANTGISGGMVFYDGQMDDARFNSMLIATGTHYGGSALNYCKVAQLNKSEGKITGVSFTDTETGKEYTVEARSVINATGPNSDKLRQNDRPDTPTMMAPSTGVHVILQGYVNGMGIIHPKTHNGSVMFMLPWHKSVILGTTDTPGFFKMAREKDLLYLAEEMRDLIRPEVYPGVKNIMSAWSGVRPLAVDRSASDSTSAVRAHVVEVSPAGLVTVTGGKWTSYRAMAEEAVSTAAKVGGLPGRECVTKHVRVIGSHSYDKSLGLQIAKKEGISSDIAEHLADAYGDRAWKVCAYANGVYTRIDPRHPYITAEVLYTIDHENVRNISDYLGRRSFFAYFDVRAAHAAVPGLAKIFSKRFGWSAKKERSALQEAYYYLDTMGYSLLRKMERQEKEFLVFSGKLGQVCVNKVCDGKSVRDLVQKVFKEKVPALNGLQMLSTKDALKVVHSHFNILP